MTVQHAARMTTYAPTMIGLHWLMAVLIAAVFATIEVRGYFPKGSETRDLLKSLHYMLGLSVLLLVAVRLVVRARNATPAITPPLPRWQSAAAHFVHAVLCAAMIAMPLLGWLILSADGEAVPFFGLSLPPLIGADKDLSHSLEEMHEFIGNALYFVIGAHTLAALVHHYLHKDDTLKRMLPTRRSGALRH
jgi:cytochrome b561